MTALDDITGLVLAGGRGTRMGHVDKGLQPFRGAAMVQHVMQRLAPQVGALAINANRNLDLYAGFGVPVWPDRLTGFEGPLAGLATGMARCATPLLATAPCDSPFLPPDLVARLHQALSSEGADLALAETEEPGPGGTLRVQPQPVFALVRTAALPQLEAYLAGGGRRMDGWYAGITVARVRFGHADDFRNINTLDELRQCEPE
ncbi:molybdenum cofactor guanylyltransferase MobA [Massilia atriviolacea]|uniref:Molybdenum cofactor guanylyltransferase n=1 Tax=Massilia atriviolacea TaxID=2495579 RepID=A0A430HJ78_9BURK|nr:molybdenum cofactor guanylyltransferase MobA [Massilia atriviolacea]RSZ57577.1 molybdenum cofactor guanylyltransferase MobA [Massilia atriviolacea]